MSTEVLAMEQPSSTEAPPRDADRVGDSLQSPAIPSDVGAGGGPATVHGHGAPAYPALPHTLELLLDVRINVTVEVGRVQMPVRQVMELAPGAVIELERSASEPVEIHANGRCIGRGEIVVVGEQFGVRVTDLGSTQN